MNADTGAALAHTLTYTYDPRDRVTGLLTDGAQTEAYTHDATGNVTAQTINTTQQTTFSYDRDRLLSAAGASTASYNYDPLGRLDTVTVGWDWPSRPRPGAEGSAATPGQGLSRFGPLSDERDRHSG